MWISSTHTARCACGGDRADSFDDVGHVRPGGELEAEEPGELDREHAGCRRGRDGDVDDRHAVPGQAGMAVPVERFVGPAELVIAVVLPVPAAPDKIRPRRAEICAPVELGQPPAGVDAPCRMVGVFTSGCWSSSTAAQVSARRGRSCPGVRHREDDGADSSAAPTSARSASATPARPGLTGCRSSTSPSRPRRQPACSPSSSPGSSASSSQAGPTCPTSSTLSARPPPAPVSSSCWSTRSTTSTSPPAPARRSPTS